MTSLKTKNICFLAAFLFLSIVPTLAEVVKSVSECNQFLNQETPPHIPGVLESGNILDQNRYKVICQTYENRKWFLTVYDTTNRIPVFSAYKYKGRGGGNADTSWKIEPKLENNADPKDINMKKEEEGKTYTKQAVNADYNEIKAEFSKGHLYPVSYAVSSNEKTSTYTLTNAVPQIHSFNGKSWAYMEKCIRYIMDYYMQENKMTCFVVVGAKPSTEPSGQAQASARASSGASAGAQATNKLEGRVNIPSVMWSAFYCSNAERAIAGAHWGNNVKINSKTLLVMKTLEELRNNDWAKGTDAFPGKNPEAFDINDINGAKVKQNVGNNCRFQ